MPRVGATLEKALFQMRSSEQRAIRSFISLQDRLIQSQKAKERLLKQSQNRTSLSRGKEFTA